MIVPAKRLENGYRQYPESQVETAQLVNSLRQAEVSRVAIRTFLQASPEDKERLLEEWRNKAAFKLRVRLEVGFIAGQRSRVPEAGWRQCLTKIQIAHISREIIAICK